jgi:hypothetical protein
MATISIPNSGLNSIAVSAIETIQFVKASGGAYAPAVNAVPVYLEIELAVLAEPAPNPYNPPQGPLTGCP